MSKKSAKYKARRKWRGAAILQAKFEDGAGVDCELALVVADLVPLGVLQPSVLQQLTFRYCAGEDL